MINFSATELEVKILDPDLYHIQKRLELIGAECLGERFQEIYTYNIYSIHTRIEELMNLYSIYGQDTAPDVARSLQSIIKELSYLLSAKDAENLNNICVRHNVASWDEFQSRIESLNYKTILDEASRVIQKYRINNNKWARLRRTKTDQGAEITTIAVKEIVQRRNLHGSDEFNIDSLKETEVGVDNFEKAKLLLESLGYYFKSYQEKRRVSYLVDGVCVDIDTWPLIPPYIEIEGKTEEAISSVLKKLYISRNSAIVASTESVFMRYGIDILSMRILSFK